MNFRELITARAAYADKARKPRTFSAMAKLCGFSRPHLYSLFYGQKTAPAWTVVKIAKGLKVSVEVVEKALELSRRQADPTPSKPKST